MRKAILCLALAAGLAARDARAANSFLEPVVTGADNPMYVVDRGDGTLFVVERGGKIRIASAGTLQASNDAFLDLTVDQSGEGGLLSMALDPNFAMNRRFFVAYTRTGSGGSKLETVIASYLVKDGDSAHADPATRNEILTQLSPPATKSSDFTNHKGGTLLFSPVDHFLYYGFGDGGSGGDPLCNAQTGTTLLGKMIRIDPGNDPNHPSYGIPTDNPFAAATDGTRPEIWALGVRNPFRYSFDRANGDLWIGDVGQDTLEEVDRQPGSSHGGENYGWKIWEGEQCYAAHPNQNASPSACPASVATCASDSSSHDGYVFPVVDYPHSFGNVVIGGYVYRGSNEVWRGRYVFADEGASKIVALLDPNSHDPSTLPLVLSQGDVQNPVAFAEDHTGELLIVGLSDGTVYRLHFDALGAPKAQVRCIVKLNQDFAGLADFESGKIRSCIDQGARGRAVVGTCLAADPKSALAKRRARIASDDTKLCVSAPPDFGYAGAGPGGDAAVGSEMGLFGDVFGDPNSAIPLKSADRNTVVCQESVAKALASCQHVRRAEFLRCKARGVADQSITSSDTLATCLRRDPKGAIARACNGTTGVIATRVIPRACTRPGVDLKVAFPGCATADPSALAQCLDHSSQHETCSLFNSADNLGTTCP